jgi:large subunit ribosomal protein L9
MKVILRQDCQPLGKIGETVTVKDGYARNYLIPKGIAVLATPKSMARLVDEQKAAEKRVEKDRRGAEKLAKELADVSITAAVSVGEEDRVFGSVTSQTVADLLSAKGYTIDKKKVMLDEPIKALGIYNVIVKLHTDVEASVRLWVVKE